MHTVAAADLRIPALGFGTWELEGDTCTSMVETALELGYRHIDTAYYYKNEGEVGRALTASGIPRDEIFVTSKVWPESFARDALLSSAERSATLLGGPTDLLLLHWPSPLTPLAETIGALNEAKARGLTRGIGLSNFPSKLIKEVAELSETPIATNQVEYHPYLSQQTVIQTMLDMGGSVTAWSPLAQGKVIKDPVLTAIGEAHGKSAGQVALRWLVQQEGVIAIPRTANAARAAENLAVFDFSLSDAEMAAILDLADPAGRIGDWIDPAYQWDKR